MATATRGTSGAGLNAITAITITGGGSGYTSLPTITITGGGGTGATASFTGGLATVSNNITLAVIGGCLSPL